MKPADGARDHPAPAPWASTGEQALFLEYYPWIIHKFTKKVGPTTTVIVAALAPARAACVATEDAMFSLTGLLRPFRRPTPPRSTVAHRPIVGLDIGSSAIKMAEIQRSGPRWNLLRCGLQPLPPDAVVDGQIKQPDTVTQAIQTLLTTHGVTTKQAAISLGGSSVITKKIQMASLTELELEDQIALEAEEYIPFDIDEVNLDFQILGQNNDTMEILLTACKRELIHGHTEVVRQAGLEPRVCDLDLFCLINAYQAFIQPYAAQTTPGLATVALVNLGATFLNIALVTHQGLPGYIRDHSLGSRQIVQEIKSRLDTTWAEAEQRLIMPEQTPQRHSEQADWHAEIITPFLEQVVQQIRQAVSFHKTGNPDQPVTAIYLSGGAARLPQVDTLIQERMEIPVYIATPLANLTHRMGRGKQKSATAPLIAPTDPRFLVALGLALRGERR
ncbi:MAG: type IV pilus assembly protein PilM [Magnetococcales bacterium]|nr:type IV pilus assembly protein PilM [Magnetococcales bacterium]